MQESLDDFLVLDLQLRHGFGQGRGDLMQRQYGLLAGQNRVGVFQQAFPVLLHRAHLWTHSGGRRRQAGGRVALLQITPAPGKIVARIAEQLERGRLAGGGFGGVLGDTLGQHAQFASVADVLFVVDSLGVEVREVGEQQHDEDDQRDEQHDNLRPAARPFHWLACFCFYHRSSPVNQLLRLPETLWERACSRKR